jgi:hypothetical protein
MIINNRNYGVQIQSTPLKHFWDKKKKTQTHPHHTDGVQYSTHTRTKAKSERLWRTGPQPPTQPLSLVLEYSPPRSSVSSQVPPAFSIHQSAASRSHSGAGTCSKDSMARLSDVILQHARCQRGSLAPSMYAAISVAAICACTPPRLSRNPLLLLLHLNSSADVLMLLSAPRTKYGFRLTDFHLQVAPASVWDHALHQKLASALSHTLRCCSTAKL